MAGWIDMVAAPLPSNVVAVFLAAVFMRGVLHKINDPAFIGTLADYRLLPEWALRFAVPALIGAEILTVALLVLPVTRPVGAVLAIAMLAIYAAAIAVNLLRDHREIDCGCGGAGDFISWGLVARNALLTAMVLPLLHRPAIAIADGAYSPAGLAATLFCVAMLILSLTLAEGVMGRSTAIALRITHKR